MSKTVISVRNLGKKYRLGVTLSPDTLRDHIMHAASRLLGRGNGEMRHAQDDEFWALKDVSFDVQQGDVLGVIGPNGSGKSTLLKILTRITEPTEGEVRLKGRVASLLEVGTGFHQELTGRENIYMNGAILGMTRAEINAKFDEIVAFAGVDKFLDTPVKRYSSGMRVRLGFAVAAHLEPEILLVDEVLAVGDASFQKKCLGKMDEVAKGGRTVLFVSHNMQAVNTLCGRGILLDQGRVKQMGETEDVVTAYLQGAMPIASDCLEQTWPDRRTAPGNAQIRMHRIAFIAEHHGDEQLIEVATPIRVEIDYWNLVPQTRLLLDLCLYSLDGDPVFETMALDETGWHDRPFPVGLFRSCCHIPGNLLNEGRYRARVIFMDESIAILYDATDAAAFVVHDFAPREISWYGKYIGHIRPKLLWKTQLIQSGL
jgi:lipopolysaccharide transport system ATP-binding protein